VADFGDSRWKRRQFVAEFGNNRRIRQMLPKTATVAKFGD